MFPVFKNKKFQDLSTGKIIQVLEQFEDVAILEGKQRININKLLDRTLYEEYIDPGTFFNSGSLQSLAEKIKSIPQDVLSNIKEEDDTPIILAYDPEEEKRMLLEKAKNMNPTDSVKSQMEKFKEILDAEDIPTTTVVNHFPEPIERTTMPNPQITRQTTENPQSSPTIIVEEDPMVKLFKNVKRKQDFSFTLSIENKIPRPDFIEMMEDSYEYSLIDFLADEFTKQIISNPDYIKDKIKDELNSLVYGRKEKRIDEPKVESKTTVETVVTKKRQAKNKKENDSSVIH